MKIAMMIIGGALVAFGLVDLIGSFTDFDLWGVIGIQLPEIVWSYSAYIEMVVGYLIFKFGSSISEGESSTESEGA